MSWPMGFIQSHWSFDHFQKLFPSIKIKKCHVNTNPQDHSGTENIPGDASMIDPEPPEYKLVVSKKKLPKIPKIDAVGTSKSTKGC